jgi:biotin carboxyl carrier protein
MEKEANKWVTLNRGEYLVTIGTENYKVWIGDEKNVKVSDVAYTINTQKMSDDVYELKFQDSKFEITLEDSSEHLAPSASAKLSSKYQIGVNGSTLQVIVDDQRSLVAQSWLRRKPHSSKTSILRAPMPGLITKVMVQKGDIVQRGAVLLVLEAMKMENDIKALQQCKIESISVQPGTTVERNDELLNITEM